MTLTKMVPEQGRGRARWVAVWRTERGNFVHEPTAMMVQDHTADEAADLARQQVPAW